MQESGQPFDLPFPSIPVPVPPIEVQKAIVQSAHDHGLIAVGHALSLKDTVTLIEAGVDGLAHACCEELSTQDLSIFSRNKPFVIPTLVVQASAGGEEAESRAIFSEGLGKEDRTHMCECLGIAKKGFTMKNAARNVQLFKKEGLEIVWYVETPALLLSVFCLQTCR
jgi:imidazolonepropionase-like amidohydrolase